MDEVWRGAAPARHCGGAGTLTLASHLAIAMEGLGALAATLGLDPVFAPAATARLRPYRIEIALQADARAGEALFARCRIGAADGTALSAHFEHRREGDETLLAEITVHAAHVSARTGEAFAWPARVRARLEALKPGAAPPAASPRAPAPEGMTVAGRGMIAHTETDGAGAATPEAVLARLQGALAGGPAPRRCDLALGALPGTGQTYRILGVRSAGGGVARMVRGARDETAAEAHFDAAPPHWPQIEGESV